MQQRKSSNYCKNKKTRQFIPVCDMYIKHSYVDNM